MEKETHRRRSERPTIHLVDFNRDTHNFGLALFNKIELTPKQNCKNVYISPLSIHMGLGLLYMGAAGNTKRAMSKELLLPEVKVETARLFHRILSKYNISCCIKLLNRIFVAEDITVDDDFAYYADSKFRSSIANVDFGDRERTSRRIEKWFNSETQKKVKNLIRDEYYTDETKAIVLNVIFFGSPWKYQFSERKTDKASFWLNERDSINVNMMQGLRQNFLYGSFKDLDCEAIEMPFNDKDFAMLIMLPRSRTGLDSLISKLAGKDINNYRKKMQMEDVRVAMPKFRFEFHWNVNNTLRRMGAGIMFDPLRADFSDLSKEPMSIAAIIHKTYVDVNEKGAEQGAGTGDTKEARSVPKRNFTADRPFLFGIVTQFHIFFWGALRDPKSKECETWN